MMTVLSTRLYLLYVDKEAHLSTFVTNEGNRSTYFRDFIPGHPIIVSISVATICARKVKNEVLNLSSSIIS